MTEGQRMAIVVVIYLALLVAFITLPHCLAG